ncbi:MAG: aminoglycoside N(3)-acetyltransferase [Halapricum sp.]
MGDPELVERTTEPVTTERIVADLRDLGVEAGDTLLVHSSLRSVGWVVGGPQAVVEGLQEAVTESGTVVVPTHTSQYTDPAGWSNPAVPDEWYETIRTERPPYRPDVTQSWGVGIVPECLRTYPDAVRSRHPVFSFAAWGGDAETIAHEFDDALGEGSPLARVYELDGSILLLGVGHDSNTSLHLAEYRADVETERVENTVPILRDGERATITYEDIETSTDDFADLGAAFEDAVGVREGTVGEANAKLIDQPSLVDFAVEWFEANR